MKKVSFTLVLIFSFSISMAHCTSSKEQNQQQANDKLKDAYVDVALGGLEVLIGGYRVAQGDITGEGIRSVTNGVDEFKEACDYNREAREMEANE